MNQKIKHKDPNGVEFIQNVGSKILGLLNGVKHTHESFSQLHGLDPNHLIAVFNGEESPNQYVLDAIKRHSPLRVRDLYANNDRPPIQDDTMAGVIVFSAQDRESTKRIFERGPKNAKVPFYEYADTAMSRTSLFRPEWIRELYVHDGVSSKIPTWAFNNGHFEQQVTYFIGPVNFHWIDKDKNAYIQQMNTGDTNYITPFVKHTFTTRKAGEGLILAVTYGGAIATEDYQDSIQTMSLNEFLSSLKGKLTTLPIDLPTDTYGGVILRDYNSAEQKESSLCSVRNLIESIPSQPNTRALELTVIANKRSAPESSASERWGYNIGQSAVELVWRNYKETILPGGSFFIRPGVEHSFICSDNENGKIIIMEIQPDSGDPLYELSMINRYAGEEGLARVHSEYARWFN